MLVFDGWARALAVDFSTGLIDDGYGDLIAFSAFEEVYGGDGADTFVSGSADDFMRANGHGTASYAKATSGVSVELLGHYQDTRGAGFDSLNGMDVLVGSSFDDTLTGAGKDDTLRGGAGDDILIAADSEDRDLLDGGEGFDTLSFLSYWPSVTVDLAAGTLVKDGGLDFARFTSIEKVVGSREGDVFYASAGDDVIVGGGASGNVKDRVSYEKASAAVTINLAVEVRAHRRLRRRPSQRRRQRDRHRLQRCSHRLEHGKRPVRRPRRRCDLQWLGRRHPGRWRRRRYGVVFALADRRHPESLRRVPPRRRARCATSWWGWRMRSAARPATP